MNTEKAIKFLNDQGLYKNSYPEDDLQEHIARQMQIYANEQLRLHVVSTRTIYKYWMYSALFGLGYILVDFILYVC